MLGVGGGTIGPGSSVIVIHPCSHLQVQGLLENRDSVSSPEKVAAGYDSHKTGMSKCG